MGRRNKKAKLDNEAMQKVPKEDVQEGGIRTSNFALQVAKHVIQQSVSKGANVVCSPVSILAVGARNSTLEQLLTLLGHDNVRDLNASASKLTNVLTGSNTFSNKNAPRISYVSALWLDRRFTLKPRFKNLVRELHNVEARAVDFVNEADQAVVEANSWASKETKGLIRQVLARENIDDLTVFFLANALYFKGRWQNHFESRLTRVGGFHLLNGDTIRVPLMNQYHEYFEYGMLDNDDCQVLKMPYKKGGSNHGTPSKAFSMYVFLPRKDDGLPDLMEKMKIDASLFKDQFELKSVKIGHLLIPKFKFNCDVALKKHMEELGLTLPFEKTCEDFSGMTDIIDPVYVSNIAQKCFVETDERGTVAAAVTFARGCARRWLPRTSPINFVADHPFLFVIREDVSGAILFIGTVLDPR